MIVGIQELLVMLVPEYLDCHHLLDYQSSTIASKNKSLSILIYSRNAHVHDISYNLCF